MFAAIDRSREPGDQQYMRASCYSFADPPSQAKFKDALLSLAKPWCKMRDIKPFRTEDSTALPVSTCVPTE